MCASEGLWLRSSLAGVLDGCYADGMGQCRMSSGWNLHVPMRALRSWFHLDTLCVAGGNADAVSRGVSSAGCVMLVHLKAVLLGKERREWLWQARGAVLLRVRPEMTRG